MSWSTLKKRIRSLLLTKASKIEPDIESSSAETSDLAVAKDLMMAAIDVMSTFPADFSPQDIPMPEIDSLGTNEWMRGVGIEEILSDQKIQLWLQDIMDIWPDKLLPTFVQSSRLIAYILRGYGVGEREGLTDLLEMGISDPASLNLILALAEVDRESKTLNKESGSTEDLDPMGFKKAAMKEILRRRVALRAPFARTLTTLLGHDALLWLTADSQDGIGKIQPHEFSRTGWRDIWSIENQLAIEQELLKLADEEMYLAKIIVSMSWTLAALASFVQPVIFFGENTSHLVSEREGKYTVACGTASHTLVAFQPASMLPLLKILAEGLTNPLISAADLMWIGAGLARVREVKSGLAEAAQVTEESFEIFLSHRGRDAKQSLSMAVQALNANHGVFLDCLTLPRGVINRNFVFGSLARSKRVLIVKTENFSESEWCRKEAWFADAMATQGLAMVDHMTLSDASVQIATHGPYSTRRRSSQGLNYPIAQRVLKDIDYWARTPNLHSLKESGYPTECLEQLQSVFDANPNPNDPAWVLSIGRAVAETLSRVVEVSPETETLDLWSTALQFSVAAFAFTSYARSKNEVRRGIDQLNAVLRSVVTSRLHHAPAFKAQAVGYLALLAAATVIDLAGFDLDQRMLPAVSYVVRKVARLQDGLLLLDVREPGATRDFRLQLVAKFMQGNIGSLGIVQDAFDEVHQGWVDNLPLEVLPCVTLYPGMNSLFDTALPV